MKHTEMKQLSIFDKINPYNLFRKEDPATSKQAALKLNVSKKRAFVLGLVQDAGAHGITIKEMTRAHLDMPTSSISSRPNELEKLGLIFYLGDKREGSRIIRDIKYKAALYEKESRSK